MQSNLAFNRVYAMHEDSSNCQNLYRIRQNILMRNYEYIELH
jgi:hypothetical protein